MTGAVLLLPAVDRIVRSHRGFGWQAFSPRAWGWLIALGFAQLFSQILIVVAYWYASEEKVGPFIYYCVIVFAR